MNLKELAETGIFDKRNDVYLHFSVPIRVIEPIFSSREKMPFLSLARSDAGYAPSDLKTREGVFSDRKDESKHCSPMLLTYGSDSYAGDPYGEKMDINGIVEKALEEITRMKERRSAAGG